MTETALLSQDLTWVTGLSTGDLKVENMTPYTHSFLLLAKYFL